MIWDYVQWEDPIDGTTRDCQLIKAIEKMQDKEIPFLTQKEFIQKNYPDMYTETKYVNRGW